MKVVAINGSARKDGNTAILINYVFSELHNEGIETGARSTCRQEDSRLHCLLQMLGEQGPAMCHEGRLCERVHPEDDRGRSDHSSAHPLILAMSLRK